MIYAGKCKRFWSVSEMLEEEEEIELGGAKDGGRGGRWTKNFASGTRGWLGFIAVLGCVTP